MSIPPVSSQQSYRQDRLGRATNSGSLDYYLNNIAQAEWVRPQKNLIDQFESASKALPHQKQGTVASEPPLEEMFAKLGKALQKMVDAGVTLKP